MFQNPLTSFASLNGTGALLTAQVAAAPLPTGIVDGDMLFFFSCVAAATTSATPLAFPGGQGWNTVAALDYDLLGWKIWRNGDPTTLTTSGGAGAGRGGYLFYIPRTVKNAPFSVFNTVNTLSTGIPTVPQVAVNKPYDYRLYFANNSGSTVPNGTPPLSTVPGGNSPAPISPLQILANSGILTANYATLVIAYAPWDQDTGSVVWSGGSGYCSIFSVVLTDSGDLPASGQAADAGVNVANSFAGISYDGAADISVVPVGNGNGAPFGGGISVT